MSITIDLAEHIEQALQNQAEQKGLNSSQYAGLLVQNGLQKSAPLQAGDFEQELNVMRNRTPEQIAEARERVLARSRRAKPLPPGKTLEDVFNEARNLWVGVTDEQVNDALEELS